MDITSQQIKIIKTTWAIPAANPEDSGEAVLLAFFEKYPHNQEYFKAFKNVPLETLKGNSGFRKHATRVITVIDTSIKCLESDDPTAELQEIWGAIGQTHFKRKISKKSFDELSEVIVDVLTAVCKLDAIQRMAWNTLFGVVYPIIFEKYA